MDEPRFDSTRDRGPDFDDRARSSAPGPAIAVAAILAVIVAAAGWYWLRRDRAPSAPPAAGAPAPEPAAAAPARADGPALELPPLSASDTLVRELVSRLSAHPRWIAWLAHDELVRRFVASVINVAEGVSPASHLRFLTPAERFSARDAGGRTVIDAGSYRRFDTLTEVFVSLDEEGTARLYRQLHPLFEQAYREIGDPARDFDGTLELALGNVLRVRVPDRPIEVLPGPASWQLAERELESWTTADKHLLRLGPGNARRIQDKLRALAAALGLAPR